MDGNESRTLTAVTPKTIKSLRCPPTRKQIYVVVSKDLHLCVAVARTGSRSFVYRRKLNGRLRERHLENFPGVIDDAMGREIIKRALGKAGELNARIARGENPFDEAAVWKLMPTFRDLFENYMQNHIEKKSKWKDEIEKSFGRYFKNLGKCKADEITHDDVDQLHKQIGSLRGPYSANRAMQLGRAVYYFARKRGLYRADNPFAGISRFAEFPRDRFLSAEEAGKLVRALQTAPTNPVTRTLRDFVLLALLTGARKTNVLSMRWDELDAGHWTIPGEKTKNGQAQIIPLGPTELEVLEGRRDLQKGRSSISPFVFPGKGKLGHIRDLKKSWTTLRKQLELEDVTVHDLRRSLAATMASNNVNSALIKNILNHRDLKTTLRHYAKTNKQAELEAKQLAHEVYFRAAELVSA